MAERKNIFHDENTRNKIQVSQLINVLTNHALGKNKLEATRIKAIEILLKKALPDLQSIQLSGDPDNPVKLSFLESIKPTVGPPNERGS